MANIIVNYKLFTTMQEIYIYEKGVCVEILKASIKDIPDVVGGLQDKYDIKQINLCGNPDYLARFKAELYLKFANKDIEINIVKR